MEEVAALVLQLAMAFGHNSALFLPIRRPVLFPREVALGAFQPLALVGQVERFDGGSVRVVGVLENPYVDANALLGILRLLRWVVRGFDTEDSVPLTGRFLLDGDGLDFGVVGNVAVEGDRDFTEFREPQSSPTARVLELEAGLTVGETAVLALCFPVERYLFALGASRGYRTAVVRPSEELSSELVSGRSTTS